MIVQSGANCEVDKPIAATNLRFRCARRDGSGQSNLGGLINRPSSAAKAAASRWNISLFIRIYHIEIHPVRGAIDGD